MFAERRHRRPQPSTITHRGSVGSHWWSAETGPGVLLPRLQPGPRTLPKANRKMRTPIHTALLTPETGATKEKRVGQTLHIPQPSEPESKLATCGLGLSEPLSSMCTGRIMVPCQSVRAAPKPGGKGKNAPAGCKLITSFKVCT